MFLKKYGIANKTHIDFKSTYGINLKQKIFLLPSIKHDLFNNLSLEILTGKKLYEKTQRNIEYYKNIRCFRGIRHIKGYPVRGQRTHTNANKKVKKLKFFSKI